MPVTWTQRFADNFNRANEANLLAPYSNFGFNTMQLNGLMVAGKVNANPNGSLHSGVLGDIQYAEIDMPLLDNGGLRHGLILRFTAGPGGYVVRVQKFTLSYQVNKITNAGVLTNLVPPLGGAYAGGASRLRFEAIGTTLNVYRTGVLIGTVQNSLFASGKAGIYSEEALLGADYKMDNFSSGDGVLTSSRRRRHRGGEFWGIVPEIANYISS
jgi:hypothetical protein